MIRLLTVIIAILLAAAGGVAVYIDSRNPETAATERLWTLPKHGAFVRLSGGNTWYAHSGKHDAPLVVMVHGLAIPSLFWTHNIAALEQAGYQVLQYDQYGRGYSARPAGTYRLDDLARQLDELLAALSINTPYTLVCVSAGCPVAATYAQSPDTLLAGVILIDPQLSAFSAQQRSSINWLARLQQYNDLDGLFSHIKTTYPDIADHYARQRKVSGYGRALDEISAAQAGIDPLTRYASLRDSNVPLVLIEGERDRGQARRAELMAALPTLEYFEVPGATHGANYHAPDVTNAFLLQALRRINTPSLSLQEENAVE